MLLTAWKHLKLEFEVGNCHILENETTVKMIFMLFFQILIVKDIDDFNDSIEIYYFKYSNHGTKSTVPFECNTRASSLSVVFARCAPTETVVNFKLPARGVQSSFPLMRIYSLDSVHSTESR